ncbi:peptide deformylase [Marchantia polymorpha subsp. ruderalis]|uniref:Peptide deformylase n=2 Tax=Marchantia polymorpha TaxID=3197 RepID=A0AAF6BKK5_MARPO|nr:hypothetical protein MARPO_0058s0077 [Marchantia polymorpha]BBN12537.1 hypothetical protein Mp_5g20960 [Marchantia polymorpha subsp. ruderalis]PTQ37296.1 hypothetical protein MARPO_0058s0077 [Marchantia polymorpha]PTQ37297.1 hypothetical protein MARPO_0058s0077 [Marchantia polymorpha]BBN12538.1 hypothetical protein Mp_5g20960 [Marchantia polymorpha subsp. ruderalis]|eukprot:PTQ37295.1 hypothetical protein MARPO_0058s0077 [Marchantia polymorpha]
MYTNAGLSVRPWVISQTAVASTSVTRLSKWASMASPLFSAGLLPTPSSSRESCREGRISGNCEWERRRNSGIKRVGLLRAKLGRGDFGWIRKQNGLGLGLQTQVKDGRDLLVPSARRGFLTELQSLREETENPPGPVEFESPLGVILYPDPRLRKKNKKISVFDERLQELVTEMFDVMYKTDGVGLSAPQVGVNVQLMLYNPEGERGKGQEYVLVNPKIVKYSKQRDIFKEGCLSFPELEADVERPLNVRVEAQDVKGKKFAISLKGWQARIFQHEYDHLEGILFHDRMTTEAVSTILPGLVQLEEAYEKASGLPAPEKVNRV